MNVRPRSAIFLGMATTLLALTASGLALAEAPLADAVKVEARDRFDRAVRLFREKNHEAALAEFRRVYELAPNAAVLFNIGSVCAALGRPVEAVEAMDRVLGDPGTLPEDRVARARTLRTEQAALVGSILVNTVPGAAIEVDGLEVAKAPLARPLNVASGTHVVGVVTAGYAPARKEVVVAGGTTTEVKFELLPMPGRLAHLVVRTHLPAARVVIDGSTAGRTPVAASITLPPGTHRVELVRAGFTTAGQEVTLGEGANGEVSLEPEPDARALETHGATLLLSISQPQSVVTLNGKTQGAYSGSLHVPPGVHRLRVEHGGYLAYEGQIDLTGGQATSLTVELFPTPETLASYSASAKFHRTWGWIGVAGGVALAGGAIGFLVENAGPTNTSQAAYNALEYDVSHHLSPCNISSGNAASACNQRVTSAYNDYQNHAISNDVAYVTGGVGLAAIGVGILLLATGDDVHRYDQKPTGDLLLARQAVPVPWHIPGGGGVLWGGVF